MQELPTRAWVDIDLGALRRNGAALGGLSGVPLLPMVKADAYGLGAVEVSRALEEIEPWGFGVSAVFEGAELRAAGVTRPIMVFTPLLADELAEAAQLNLTPALSSTDTITSWGETGKPWHLAIDTGMSRAGVGWCDVEQLVPAIRKFAPQGAFTHFHSAQADDGSMQEQEQRFAAAIAELPNRPEFLHVEGSAGIVRHDGSPFALVRPGIFLYGVGSGPGALLLPEPVVHLRARVVDLRNLEPGDTVSYDATFRASSPMRLATVAIGYADGYPRALSGKGAAMLRGETLRVVGRVTMDMTMVDVSAAKCSIGDTITFIGRDGDALVTVESAAEVAGMSPYELLTGLRGRVLRRYVET